MYTTPTKNIRCLLAIYIFCVCLIISTIIYLEREPLQKETVLDDTEEHWPQNQLFDLNNFSHLLSAEACPENTEVILIVTSYSGDVETRSSLRQAYPERLLISLGIKRVFLLAVIDRNKAAEVTQEAIENEQERFGDMVQGNFIENYRNLTYKHVMGLRWAAEFCENAKFIIKMDHDIVVDFFSIIKMLRSLPAREIMLAGERMSRMKPIREASSKWYVPEEEYSQDTYPDFLSGWLYITNPYTAKLLVKTAQHVPYFWIDDLYVTGLLVEKLKIPLVALNKYYTTHPEHLTCCIDALKFVCDYWVGPNGGDNRLVKRFATFSENCFKVKCQLRIGNNSVARNCPFSS